MKINFCKNLPKPIKLFLFLITLISFKGDLLNAEYLFADLQLDSSTKTDENKAVIPTNPLEIVEMIKRHNSLNDATKPSDAVNDALKSFQSLEEKSGI